MPNVLAMSFEGELAPSFDLRCLHPGKKPPDGWGIGYYPGSEPAASVLKEPAPTHGSIRSELIKAWEHLASPLMVMHIRTARWGGRSDANTQPFSRGWGGRDWLFAHSGSLQRLELAPPSVRMRPSESAIRKAAPFDSSPQLPHDDEAGDERRKRPRPRTFEPIGSTDTELIFCDLLERFARHGWRSLGEADPAALRAWLEDINEHGSLNVVLTDGHDLALYGDRRGDGAMYTAKLRPPFEAAVFADADLEVDLMKRGVKSRVGIVASSSPMEPVGATKLEWTPLPPGTLLLVRQGQIRAEVRAPEGAASAAPAPIKVRTPNPAEPRCYDVVHKTIYRYQKPIERSTHVFRLRPIHDTTQALLSHGLSVSVDGQTVDYEDVFGNRVRRLLVDEPFTELAIEAKSRVLCMDIDPLGQSTPHVRSSIPLVWMPWQRQVLQPFLLPPELAESELAELTEYAMSFVNRNDYDLLDTLLDLNSTIHREYAYRQNTTNLATTPFDVYANRRGVCQDFANLFICLARLLSIPARYVCGYIYTGPKSPNQAQSEASHAWVQVYLPEVGWRGFDPTNGTVTQTEHVRVAVGRNYVDATPTSGTIYVGGGGETLSVDVTVTPVPT